MTEVTDAHRAEARRRLNFVTFYEDKERRYAEEILTQALAEDAWTPTEDPVLIEARECAALAWEALGDIEMARLCRLGEYDRFPSIQAPFIAIKRRQS